MVRSASDERGSVMLVAMVTLVGLLGIGGLAILSIQSGQSATGHERFRRVARYAAESGIAAGMEYLRDALQPGTLWSAEVVPNNTNAQPASGILGNTVPPGASGAILSPDLRAWYSVTILNNPDDPGFGTGDDTDGIVVLQSRGFGPNGTTVVIEQTISLGGGAASSDVPCPGYAQKNITELGTGFNPCLGSIQSGEVETFAPGN